MATTTPVDASTPPTTTASRRSAQVPQGTDDLSRRERKKLATRRAIQTSALRLFAEQGFDETTLQQITEAADVAPRTFFLHFASKEDVLLGDSHAQTDAFRQALAERPAHEPPFDAVRAAIITLVSAPDVDDEEVMLRARLMEEAPSLLARNLENYTHLESVIAEDAARRCGVDARTDVYPNLLCASVMSAVRIAVAIWYRRGGTTPLANIVAESLDLVAAGLRDAPGERPS